MLTTFERIPPKRPLCLRAMCLVACLLGLVMPAGALAAAGSAGLVPNMQLQGKFVVFNQVGFEPDGDPLDRAVISATVHVTRPPGYHDLKLILSMYLENFLPRTAPELPDLLHPDQTATSLAGFFQGKAALVRGDGKIAFWGSVLAEAFFDNSVHVAISLARTGAPPSEPALSLLGSFDVGGSLGVTGAISPTDGLTPEATTALRAGGLKRVTVSWQSVMQSLTVAIPRMMGTSGSSAPGSSSTPADLSSTYARSAHLSQAARGASGRAGRPAAVLPATSSQPLAPSRQARAGAVANTRAAGPDASPSASTTPYLAAAGGVAFVVLVAVMLWLGVGRSRARLPLSAPERSTERRIPPPRTLRRAPSRSKK